MLLIGRVEETRLADHLPGRWLVSAHMARAVRRNRIAEPVGRAQGVRRDAPALR